MPNQNRLKSLKTLQRIQVNALDEEQRQLRHSLSEEAQIKNHIEEMKAELLSNHEHMTSDNAPPLDDMFAWNGYRQWETATKEQIDQAKEHLKDIEQKTDFIRSRVKDAQKALSQTESFIDKILEEIAIEEEENAQHHLDELAQILAYKKRKMR